MIKIKTRHTPDIPGKMGRPANGVANATLATLFTVADNTYLHV